MNSLAQYLMFIAGLGGVVWLQGCADIGSTRGTDHTLKVLHTMQVRFTTDGAGGSDLSQKMAAREIVDKYRARLVPILIANLANADSSASLIDGHPGVSIGYVAFDLLATIAEQDKAWYPDYDCGDDGLWACVHEDMIVPVVIDETNIARSQEAQRRWQQLYDEGRVRLDLNYRRFWDE